MKIKTIQNKRMTIILFLNYFKSLQKNTIKMFSTMLIVTSVFAFDGSKVQYSDNIINVLDTMPQDSSHFGKIEPDVIFTIENGGELISPLNVDQLHKFEIVKERTVHVVKFIVMGSGGATDAVSWSKKTGQK